MGDSKLPPEFPDNVHAGEISAERLEEAGL